MGKGREVDDLAILRNKPFVFTAIFSMLILLGVPFLDALVSDDELTGYGIKKWKKKIKAETKRFENRVEKQVARTDDYLKKAGEKAEAEAKRFGDRVEAEGERFGRRVDKAQQEFDDQIKAELERFGDRAKAEWDRTEESLNNLDDKLKDLADAPKKEWERFKRSIENELETQKAVYKNLVKGDICGTYLEATKSKIYDAKKLIYDQLMPPIMNLLRPHVTTLVTTVAAPLNSIPVFGQVLYGLAISPPTIEALTKNAAKKAIREVLEECK